MDSSSNWDVRERAVYRRAVEAVIWGMPAVNYQMMYEASARAGGPGDNQIVYWPGLLDWKNQTLTPNPDVIYLMPFFHTKDVGPLVLEVPPASDKGGLNGSIMNYWQVAIEDIGPAGVDEGRGGKCLILPPGLCRGAARGLHAPALGHLPGYGLIRSILRGGSDAEIAQAVEYARKNKLYPLSQANNAPDTAWVDASTQRFEAAIPYDIRFFQALHKIIQTEPFLHRVFPHNEGQVRTVELLLERLPAGARVLDLGCGTGVPTARQLVDGGCEVTGVDISPVMLEQARRNVPEAKFVQRDIVDAVATGDRFDAVVAFFSLLMLPKERIIDVRNGLHNVITPGGWLAIGMVEADFDDIAVPFLGAPLRVSGWPRDQLKQVVTDAGFIVEVEDVRSYAPPTPEAPPETQLFLLARRA